jgi:uncharacterized protein (DUF2336 family)
MIVHQFLKWIETAKVSERAAAANALGRAYAVSDMSFEDRCAAEAALTMLLDDPSPKVRLAMAESLSLCHRAPMQIISALANDQPEIAALVLLRSPMLSDDYLIEMVAGSTAHACLQIANRAQISAPLAAAIAEVGELEACLALVQNGGATIVPASLKRIAERHGGDASVREALLANRPLAPDTHHLLLGKLGEALSAAPLVRALMGQPRAERVAKEACVSACVSLLDQTPAAECPTLVQQLRSTGQLTSSFLVRIVAFGKIDFFGAALVALSEHKESRVRSLLADGRDVALEALFRAAGLAASTYPVFVAAIHVWREVARGKRVAGPQEVSWLMMKAAGDTDPKLSALLSTIHVQVLRDNARRHAAELQAAEIAADAEARRLAEEAAEIAMLAPPAPEPEADAATLEMLDLQTAEFLAVEFEAIELEAGDLSELRAA